MPVTNDCPSPTERAAPTTSGPSYLLCAGQKAFSHNVYLQGGDCLCYYFFIHSIFYFLTTFLLPFCCFTLSIFSIFSFLLPSIWSSSFSTIIRVFFLHLSPPLPSLPFLSLLSILFLLSSSFCSSITLGQRRAETRPAGLRPRKSTCC